MKVMSAGFNCALFGNININSVIILKEEHWNKV